MNKVMVFPFLPQNEHEVNGIYLRNDCELSSLVSLPGWNIGQICSIRGTDYTVTGNFTECLQECNILWICENDIILPFVDLCRFILATIDLKKQIWFGKQVDLELRNKLTGLDPTGKYLLFPNTVPLEWFYKYQKLSTPVIAVGGFSRDMGKFGLQVSLTQEFIRRGYKALLVGSRADAVFWGHHALPEYFLDSATPDNDKIMGLNHYFAELEHREQPDIFIVGIPGVLLPNDVDYFYDFATISYQISQAVEIDEIIMSSPCLGYSKEVFQKLEQRALSLLDAPITFHNISKWTIDFADTRETEKPSFTAVSPDFIQHVIQQCGAENVSSMDVDQDYVSHICDAIIEKYG